MQTEGLPSFVRRAFLFVVRPFFTYGNYYIYEKDLSRYEEVIKFKPKVPNCIIKVVCTLGDLDKLAAEGYDLKVMDFRPKLEKDALAFCLFVGRKLAHITWVAPNQGAKREIDYLPYKINFEAGEVCSGASFTDPAYRRRGFLSHTYSYIFAYLVKKGVVKDRFTIEVNNVASQKAHAKFTPTIIGIGRYLKILRWQSWKEKPMEETKQ